MSDEQDDPRDDSYPPGTVFTRAKCESCGGRFDAEARETEGHPGERLLEVLTRECPACTELGCEPPECPGLDCGEALRGTVSGGSAAFVCDGCDGAVSIATLRSLLFGRAC